MANDIHTFHSTVCPHDCPSACALEVERLTNSTIGKVRGAPDNDYTAGIICAKVSRYRDRVHSPDRITHPLKRKGSKGSGQFCRISWDDALDEVAESFVQAEQKYGSETIWPYFYAGTMGIIQRFGINRLRNVKKYSRQLETICSTIASAGYRAGTGACIGSDPREMAESDLILCWGVNPASTQVNVMTHISRARKKRNAQLVVIDPYRTRTAQVADSHISLLPGTDAALACAIMHVLFRDSLVDREYIKTYGKAPEELEEHLKTRSPAWAAPITGLSIEQIEDLAKMYGKSKKSYIRLGYGFTRSRNGASSMHAVTCLPALTGAWKYKGGGAFYSNWDIYNYDETLLQGLDTLDPNIRVLDMSRIGQILLGNKIDLANGPPVSAILIQNTNPAVVAPESYAVNTGLRNNDLFLCVHEQFMTDTAKLADIILPATTFLEHDDFYLGGGHSYVQVGPKLIEAHGESLDNHTVICSLAKRLGASHRGFDMTVWEIMDEIFMSAKWPMAADILKQKWYDCAPSFEDGHFLNGFKNSDQKFHFKANWSRLGSTGTPLPELPDYCNIIDDKTEDMPYRLVTAPAHNYLNTSFTETTVSKTLEHRPSIKIAPNDAEAIGIKDGTLVRVGNDLGEILLHANIAANDHPLGVVVIESLWPNSSFENGIGVNALISSEAAAPAGGAVFHDAAVWLKPVSDIH